MVVRVSYAPLKKVRLKQRSEPWFSSEILELIKERDEINKLCAKSSTPDLENKRRELRNQVQTEIKAAKKEYFQNVIEENMGDGRKMWKCLKGGVFLYQVRAGKYRA